MSSEINTNFVVYAKLVAAETFAKNWGFFFAVKRERREMRTSG